MIWCEERTLHTEDRFIGREEYKSITVVDESGPFIGIDCNTGCLSVSVAITGNDTVYIRTVVSTHTCWYT